MVENSGFAEVNAYIYHSARAAFYGAVIWCLGPVVDDTRDYPFYRNWLAAVTFRVCRCFIRADG
ncbi:MAG: hypothetical protein GTO33_13090 [Acidobacteria bacterium]|nr:hypothetical protein [Acidobacteriota bacterium]